MTKKVKNLSASFDSRKVLISLVCCLKTSDIALFTHKMTCFMGRTNKMLRDLNRLFSCILFNRSRQKTTAQDRKRLYFHAGNCNYCTKSCDLL